MKKLLCIFLALIFTLGTVSAYAEDEEILILDDPGVSEGSDDGAEDPYAEMELVPYDYEDLTIGNPTPLNGQFFTELWGNSTSDTDVRYLVNGYNLVIWDAEQSFFRFDRSVVSGAMISTDEEGNRSYLVVLNSDLYFSDGVPITAWDYAFSVLLQASPLLAELGATPVSFDYLVGYEDYAAGVTPYIAGLRVISDTMLQFTVKADSLPYFYEFSRLAVYPYPIQAIAPGCIVYDDGEGAYIANEDFTQEEPLFTADLLRQTILDPESGYQSHPAPVSGPYSLLSYDGVSAVFEINPYYKGNEEGKKPRINRLTYTVADNDTMISELAEGKYALLNKVTFASAIAEGLRLCVEKPQYTRSTYPRIGLTYLLFNLESALIQEQLVRQAIAYCLDSQQFIRSYVGSFGLESEALYGLGQWMYSAATGAIPYPMQLPEGATAAETAAYEEDAAAWEELSLDSLTRYPFDVASAVALLERGGWTLNEQGGAFDPQADTVRCKRIDGTLYKLELTLGYQPRADVEQAFNDAFVAPLAAAGIKLTLAPLTFDSVVETHNSGAFDTLDLIYMGDNFNISFDPAPFFPNGGVAAASRVEDSLPLVYQELNALSLDMDHTEPRDILGYMQKWLLFQERLTELLPLIPIYTNIYFDFYTRELTNYWIEDYTSWAQAIVPARMHSLRTIAYEAMADIAIELSYADGESDLDLSTLLNRPNRDLQDYSQGSLSLFPESVQAQVPEEYRTIYEFVSGELPEDIEEGSTIALEYAFQTLYDAGDPVYVLFGIPGDGSDVSWIVQEGIGMVDGSVSVVLEPEQWENLVGITFALVIVSK